MARYFLHLRDGSTSCSNPEGQEFPDMDALRAAVMWNARDTITGDVKNGGVDFRCRIDAENEAGEVVYSLDFKQAVNIIPQQI